LQNTSYLVAVLKPGIDQISCRFDDEALIESISKAKRNFQVNYDTVKNTKFYNLSERSKNHVNFSSKLNAHSCFVIIRVGPNELSQSVVQTG